MQSTFILCVLVVLLGAAFAVVDTGDENVIVTKPQTVEARKIEHGDDDHDHEEDHVEQDSHNANSTGDVFHNATKTSSTPDGFHDDASENTTMAFEDEDYHASEVPEVDDSGCQLRIRNELERKCFIKFEDSVASSLHIETEAQQEKEVCCALEEYEKCCYRGYKATNCNTDRESLKETLKAARIFLGAITKNSCSAHRGRCSLSSTAILEVYDSGCQLRLRDELEKKCFVKFDESVASILPIETEEHGKEVCCALEEYEKCSYRGYKRANCNTETLKENLKAARLFLRAITKNSCSAHHGRCPLSSAANTSEFSAASTSESSAASTSESSAASTSVSSAASTSESSAENTSVSSAAVMMYNFLYWL